jgi:hypothetical protein
VGGIRCALCGGDNAAGSRFCGVCGARLPTVPPIAEPDAPRGTPSPGDGPTDGGAAGPSAGRRRTDFGDDAADASLGRSLELPVSRGARAATILLVLAVDAALVVAGIWMWRAAGGRGAVDAGPPVVAGAGDTADAGEILVAPPDAAVAIRDPAPAAPGRPSPPPREPVSVPDAGLTLDDRIGLRDAALPDAAAADAAPPVAPDPIAPEPPDAAPPDASAGPLDPYEEPPPAPSDPGAPVDTEDDSAIVDAADAVARLTSRNQRRFERCYQQAAKAYTPEQPLEGEVDIAMRVMPTGDLREVSAVRNTTGSEQLARCLVAVIEGWRLAAGGGEAVDLVRPFRFGARP